MTRLNGKRKFPKDCPLTEEERVISVGLFAMGIKGLPIQAKCTVWRRIPAVMEGYRDDWHCFRLCDDVCPSMFTNKELHG